MKLGLIHDIFTLSRNPSNYWTESLVREEAKKYTSRTAFKSNSQAASSVAYKLNIMNELFPSKKHSNGYWNEFNIRNEAAKYTSKSEFDKNSKTAYRMAIKLGIINDLNLKPKGDLINRCIYAIEFSDNSVYIGLTYNFELRMRVHFEDVTKKSSARQHLKENPTLTYRKIMLTDYIHKDKASILEGIFLNKYKELGFVILNKAKTGGIGGNSKKWNKELVFQKALLYRNSTEFKYSKDGSGHNYAYLHGFLGDLIYIDGKKTATRTRWSDELCIKELSKFKSYKDAVNNGFSGAYVYACRNKLLEKIKYEN